MTDTLISNATLIDGTSAMPVPQAGVLISDGRIAAAGPLALVRQHPLAAVAHKIDAAGCWIIPGLIDAHIHATLTGVESMPVFLAAGVTTVRDIGGPLDDAVEIRDALASGAVLGPRFIFAGPLIDGEVPSWPSGVLPILESTADGRAAADLADSCVARGAGAIKLYFRLPKDSVRAVVERIAGRVPVTGHLGRTYASEAVAAGINGIEHAIVTLYNDLAAEGRRFDAMAGTMDGPFWVRLLAGWADVDLDTPRARRLLEDMREHDVSVDATLDITRAGLGTPAPAERDPRLQYVRPQLLQVWEFIRGASQQQSGAQADVAARGHASCDEYVRRYSELGGRVLAGTDVGAVPFLVPGYSLYGEIGMLVRAGIAPAKALQAATLDAARALRIDAETGSIEPGKAADLVILERDPLADIANLDSVRTVVRTGELCHPAALLASVSYPAA
jgi:hypothetical protein